jgi:hypothetical protein
MKLTRISTTAFLSSLLLLGIAAPAYAQGQQDERKDHPDQQQSKHEQAKPEQQGAQPQQQQRQDQNQPQQRAHQQQQRQDQNRQQDRGEEQQRQDRNRQQEHAQQERQDQRQQQDRAQQQRQDQNRQQQRAHQQQGRDRNDQRQYAQQRRGNERSPRTQEQHRVERSAWQEHRSQSWDSDHRTWRQRGGYSGYRIPDDRYRGYFGQNHGFRVYGLPFMVVGGYPRFQYEGYWISAVDPWPEYWGNNWYDNDDVYVTYVDNGYYMYNRRYPNAGVAISISF